MATEKYADEIRFCASCAKMCRHVCTSGTITKSESATPYGRCLLAYYIENGQLEPTKEILDVMYQCTTCGLGFEGELVFPARLSLLSRYHQCLMFGGS